jgi:CheY-like chemotaxis protein
MPSQNENSNVRDIGLVVDDEEIVRRMSARILTGQATEVKTASNGAEALEIYRTIPDRIKWVLTDENMPQLEGTNWLAQAPITPFAHPVILQSGAFYKIPAEKLIRLYQSGILTAAIRKPFLITEIKTILSLAHNFEAMETAAVAMTREALDGIMSPTEFNVALKRRQQSKKQFD